jgi:aspartate/methionine/tyrosine aminotransferase
MYAETRYLTWANRTFGRVTHNLARGGMRPVPLRDLGTPPALDDPRAWELLRGHIARFNATTVAEVLPALGTTHALWLAVSALVRPGDDVLVEHPGYEPLWRIPEGLGANIMPLERSPEDGFVLRPERIASCLTSRTKLVVMTNPHNPSGVRATTYELAEIAKTCDSAGVPLLVDEIYAPFGSELGADGVWGQSARHVSRNIVAISGLSKAFGLGSLRVGWILADEALVRRMEHAIQSSLGDFPIAQACLGLHAFAQLPRISAARERQFDGRMRTVVARWIADRPRLGWCEPQGGPFGFVYIRGGPDLTAIIERGAEQYDVLVAPGSFFGLPSAFRLGWSVDPSQLPTALRLLDEVLAPVLEHAAPAERAMDR